LEQFAAKGENMSQREVQQACIASGFRFGIVCQEPGAEPCLVAAYRRLAEAHEELAYVREVHWKQGARFFIQEL
jgi:hypothetical protein